MRTRLKLTSQHVHQIRTQILQPAVAKAGVRAWLVGGCVRDIINETGINDIDVLCTDTNILINTLNEYLRGNNIGYSTHAMENGHATVITIKSEDVFGKFDIIPVYFNIEISQMTNPQDPEDDALEFDARSRDFICNAWYMDIMMDDKPFTPLFNESGIYSTNGNYIYPCNHSKTIFDNPMRVFRALDLMCRGYKPTKALTEVLTTYINTIDREPNSYPYRPACLQIVHKIFDRLAGEEYNVKDVIYAFNYFAELGVWGAMIDPVFDTMVTCVHHNKYHHDSVWQHTMNVIQNMATYDFCEIHDMPVKPTAYDYWAAFLHDAGKPATMTVTDGITHFYEHQTESVRIATEILKDSPLNKVWTDYVLKLIKHHMDTKPFGDDPIKYRQYKHIRKLQWELGGMAFHHFLVLNHADCAASERTENKNTSNVVNAVMDMAYNRGEPAWECYKIPITGDDIIEHFPNEPRINIGKYLKQVYKVTFSRPEDYATKEQCLHYVGTLIKTGWVKKVHKKET